MKFNAGLWIDHREAILVVMDNNPAVTHRIQSDVESQLRRADEPQTGPFEAQQVPADDSRQRKYTNELARYYDQVIAHLANVESVFVFGPGEAKNELVGRLTTNSTRAWEVSVETADRMTDPQIIELVRHHFQLTRLR